MTKSQVDRLGQRLKKGNIGEDDLRQLDEYRRSHAAAYEQVLGAIRRELKIQPTGRLAKSTLSIVHKLQRESIRLSQIQDIAGCRIVLADILSQDRLIEALRALFPDCQVIDRRVEPSHGYRAVHVIVHHQQRAVEIQARTAMQHLWAEVSEKFSDAIDPAIKYGGGPAVFQASLATASASVAELEKAEQLLLTGPNPRDAAARADLAFRKRLLMQLLAQARRLLEMEP